MTYEFDERDKLLRMMRVVRLTLLTAKSRNHDKKNRKKSIDFCILAQKYGTVILEISLSDDKEIYQSFAILGRERLF